MDLFKQLSNYGLPGIVIFILVSACIYLYLDTRKERWKYQAEIKELQQKTSEEQELRTEDAKQYTELALKLQAEVISATKTISDSIEENNKLCSLVERLIIRLENGSAKRK